MTISRNKNLAFFAALFLVATALSCLAQEQSQQPESGTAATAAPRSLIPVYVSLTQDLNQYYLYANGGWDGNWYVGYNSCWIVKLPVIPRGNFSKAFIGAKLGRAKTASTSGKSWEKKPYPGKLYMSVSQTPAFTSEQTYFLVDAEDLPVEPSPNDNIKGVRGAEWFWAEVPPDKIAKDRPNYLSIWSTSEYFVSGASSPIIAGAESQGRQESVWLNRSIRGVPPREAESALETPIYYLQPAMAVKLVPQNEYKVFVRGFMAEIGVKNITLSFSAIGQDVRAGWIELSNDRFDWQRVSKFIFQPPYSVTLDKTDLPADEFYLRAVVVDSLENRGYSKEITIPRPAVTQE